jgi:RimJ/RimL family protein N-acetyltransferase
MHEALEWRRLSPELERPLASFFDALSDDDRRSFHPHPFTVEAARELCGYRGADVYGVLIEGGVVLGYGMLRGWDAGFAVPSLGIALGPAARGRGLGRLVMQLLHATAARRGARRVRLKVVPDNARAIRLYEACGYRFEAALDGGQRVAYLDLP